VVHLGALSVQAICEEGDDDPLGRKPGEPLWADDAYGSGPRMLENLPAPSASGDA
jgi:hypothetical protein